MSSTREMQLSEAEIEALTAEIQSVSSKEKLLARPALYAMLSLIRASADSLPVEILRMWLSRIKLSESIVKINASEATIPQITEIFDLKFDMGKKWMLVEDNLVDIPSILKRNLHDLEDTPYDKNSEAACRITVDIMLIQCWKYLRNKYKSAGASQSNVTNVNNSSTPERAIVNMLATKLMKRVKLFQESSLSIEIHNELVQNSKILVTGRADWSLGYSNAGKMGYSTAGDEGNLLIAIEAKQESEFSKGKAQLIAYLAILRQNLLRERKTNIVTQGFYSDGSQFGFICIRADGSIGQSLVFNIGFESDLKIVFNFIVAMIEKAIKSTPNATPTKPGQLREKEVNHFEDEVWLKVFAQMDASIVRCSDDEDMEDAIDIS